MQWSIEYANQKSYLDDLYRVYPTIPDGIREVDEEVWRRVEAEFDRKNNEGLINALLDLKLFPIKDSYIAYLRKDRGAIQRNPKTVARISGMLYQLGLDEIFKKCSEPKEANRKIGPMFRNWLNSKCLGLEPVPLDRFVADEDNAILDGNDAQLMEFARLHLNYRRDKGLDLVARFNGKYVIGEAKFLTDMGGHQNAQFVDAMETLKEPDVKAEQIAILDGVLYIKGENKLHRSLLGEYADYNIFSALLLREYLYSL